MTEQEKEENAIDEMAKDIPEKIKVMFSQTDFILLSEYLRKNISMALVKKGYRKADEVRKETAIEYSNKIDEIVDWCITNENGEDFDYEYFSNCLRNLKKDFGVEVEE